MVGEIKDISQQKNALGYLRRGGDFVLWVGKRRFTVRNLPKGRHGRSCSRSMRVITGIESQLCTSLVQPAVYLPKAHSSPRQTLSAPIGVA